MQQLIKRQEKLLVILGPTASGKTRLAVNLSGILNGEVISADSRQVFEGMDIGTGKDLNEYTTGDRTIPHHLINIKKAGENYNVNEFKEDFFRVFQEITAKQALPVLCGGTGMYVHSILQDHEYTAVPPNYTLRTAMADLKVDELRSVLSEYPHKFTAHADLSSHKRMIRAIEVAEYLSEHTLEKIERPDIAPCIIGLEPELNLRRKMIAERLKSRLEQGLVHEVEQLIADGISKEKLTFYGLEYKFVAAYLSGETDYTTLVGNLTIAICQFAKRQMTFFRKMEKDGVKINWINLSRKEDQIVEAKRIYDAYLANAVRF